MEALNGSHEFGALNTLFMVVTIGTCVIASYLIRQHSFNYLPESAASLCVGLVAGCLVKLIAPTKAELSFLSLEPDLFFFLFLPIIIFEAAFTLKKKEFFANFWTISLFAVVGTAISTFIIGYFVYFLGWLRLVTIDMSGPLEALIFGSLISSIDPVATLSIMGRSNCDPLLYSLIFGESVLNDAIAIVLFNTFIEYRNKGELFTHNDIPMFMVRFIGVSLGSILSGIFIGLLCSLICKNTEIRKYPQLEIIIIFLFAYGSYSLSEALYLSGIMSLFFCGMILSHYNSNNLSSTSQISTHAIITALASLSETLVFLYIGMGFFTGKFKHWHFFFIILCCLGCAIGRAINIFPLSFFANFARKKKITMEMQVVMCFAGLRGAVSFALVCTNSRSQCIDNISCRNHVCSR